MQIDGAIPSDPRKVVEMAQASEAAGYDGLWSTETGHDPFLPLMLAAQQTRRLQLGSGIAVAFARNPMSLASTANDLQWFSEGRFLLGLGSQVRAHIERRFSMPWSQPAARMREMIVAMHAIWDSWNKGTKLDFRGDFYEHTLMTPFFDPGPNPHGSPKVFVAAVGSRMTEIAGEVADGLLVHTFTTERYLREVTLPTVEKSLVSAGRLRRDFQLAFPPFIVTGQGEKEHLASELAARRRIAFYGSTPAYRPVLELHGWGDLQTELNRLSKDGEWEAMTGLIDDTMLDAFAIVAPPDQVGGAVLARYGGLVDRLILAEPHRGDVEAWGQVVDSLQAALR